MKPLRVCIDARQMSIFDIGGVGSFIIGLATGLSSLTDGNEEYFFLTYRNSEEWIRPYLAGACQVLPCLLPAPQHEWKNWLEKKMPAVTKMWREYSPLIAPLTFSPAKSDGTIENAGIEIMHFTNQMGFLTKVPSIYHPHDLQHVHLPQYFSKRTIKKREIQYRTFCNQARMIAVVSSWIKNDLIKHYNLSNNKVRVIPFAPVTTVYPSPTETDLSMTKRKFNLADHFILYPAQTWEHKNHLGLLQALYLLRQQHGVSIPFVSTGFHTDFFPKIEKRIRELQLELQSKFLGFVSELELQCLYKLSRAVVIPTKFEAASFPLWEAFHAEAPTGCSRVTSLPEQAGDAALLFDPERPEEMARVISRLWTDETMRRELIKRGKERVKLFTWERTARIFRAHYRRLANLPISDEDHEMIIGQSLF
ncbi:MAG: glycosyltransferase family 4 protein [Candidatus Helarchaeota archaeon]|nr:glycosyltransferase family 4 protein [Candidatus Helarchaeota archaeon]